MSEVYFAPETLDLLEAVLVRVTPAGARGKEREARAATLLRLYEMGYRDAKTLERVMREGDVSERTAAGA